jgi:hypothetical protein
MPLNSLKNVKKNIVGTRSVPDDSEYPARRLVKKPRRLSYGFLEYGYTRNSVDGDPIPDEYLVRVTSYRNECTVVAPMQDNINLNVTSNWEPLIPTSILRYANIAVQVVSGGGRSAITSSTTRRMWTGTSPMSVTLKLKFEAVNDPYYEVVEPCRLLQAMAVPSDPDTSRGFVGLGEVVTGAKKAAVAAMTGDLEPAKNFVSSLPALRPPGPTPFVWDNLLSGPTNWTDKVREDIENSAKSGDFIIIELGTFLTFWSVIIRENGVIYKTKFDKSGDPVSAEAEVRFETYEMPTKESLEHSYTKIRTPTPDAPGTTTYRIH